MQEVHGGDIYRNQVMLDFSVNVNPLGPPEEVRRALYEAVAHCGEYPDIHGEKLKAALSRELSVKKEYLVCGNGASELFMGIMHGLRPEKTLIPVPSFSGYRYAAEAVESQVIEIALREENGFSLAEEPFCALAALTGEKESILFLANPNNPTGRLVGKKELQSLIDYCKKKGVWLVVDECFLEFCRDGASALPFLEAYDRLIVVRAFTKIYAVPGVRLGYLACGNRDFIQKVTKQLPEWNLSVFAQEAGVCCLKQRAYRKKTAGYVEKERDFLTEGLRRLGIKTYESDANFILLSSGLPLRRELLKRGILIRECGNFKGLSQDYYRVAVKKRSENEKLLKALGDLFEENRAAFAGRN